MSERNRVYIHAQTSEYMSDKNALKKTETRGKQKPEANHLKLKHNLTETDGRKWYNGLRTIS